MRPDYIFLFGVFLAAVIQGWELWREFFPRKSIHRGMSRSELEALEHRVLESRPVKEWNHLRSCQQCAGQNNSLKINVAFNYRLLTKLLREGKNEEAAQVLAALPREIRNDTLEKIQKFAEANSVKRNEKHQEWLRSL